MNRRTVAPQIVRRINDRVIADLLLEHGPLTRSQLRTYTGLSQPSTAELIDRLESARVIAAVGEARSGQRGPNARLYGLVPDRAYVAVARINPIQVRAGVADLTGRIVAQADLPTSDLDHPHVTTTHALTAALGRAGVDPASVHNLVVGTQGTVDPATGDVDFVEGQPAWHGNLRRPLRDHFDRPVRLENQTNLAGLAEARDGEGRGRESFVMLSVGRGVAMAILLGGRLWRGAAGGAGELASLPASGTEVPVQDPATNTFTGGFQALVSDAELLALAERHGLGDVLGRGLEGSSPADAVTAALEREDQGGAYVGELAQRIAVGAAAVCAVLDPGLVVLAGPVGRAGGRTLAARTQQRLGRISPFATEVRTSSLAREDPVMRGAVTLALDDAHTDIWGPVG